MKEPLRVLVVEDSEDDAQFVMSELRRGGFDPTFERVFNAEEMTAALADKVWDLVISDGSMPGLGSLTALSLVKEQQPDLPFIVVSGAVGEERVVAAMKAGANDYVTKNNLARLVPSIKQELRDAENRRTQPGLKDVAIHSSALWEDGKFIHSRCFTQDITRHQEAESARAHLAAIVESSEDAIIGKTLDGVILSWNAGAEELYGYTAQEMKGQPDSILIPSYRPEEMGEIYGQIRRGERIDRFETVRIHKDGRAIEVSLTLSPIKDAGSSGFRRLSGTSRP